MALRSRRAAGASNRAVEQVARASGRAGGDLFSRAATSSPFPASEGTGLMPELLPDLAAAGSPAADYAAVEEMPTRASPARAGAGQRRILAEDCACCSCCSRCRASLRGTPKPCRPATRLSGAAAGAPGLKRLYGLTLTLTLLLALLDGASCSRSCSRERLSAPLSILAAGTRAVAQGDFSQRASGGEPRRAGRAD